MNAFSQPGRLVLNEDALRAAASHLDDGAVTPSYGPWRDDIVQLLNDALATELVCVLRYKRHYFTADGLASPQIAASSWSTSTRNRPTPTRSPSASCSWAASRTSRPTD